MNKFRPLQHSTALTVIRNARFNVHRCMRITLPLALGATLMFAPHAPRAQQAARGRKEPTGPNVVGVAASRQGKDTVVSISADGPLSRAQTWQDKGKFNIVLPYGKTALPAGSARGVKMERVGDSLLITVPTNSGSNVTVQPRGDRLDLHISGGMAEAVEEAPAQAEAVSTAQPAPTPEPKRRRGKRGATTQTEEGGNAAPTVEAAPAAEGQRHTPAAARKTVKARAGKLEPGAATARPVTDGAAANHAPAQGEGQPATVAAGDAPPATDSNDGANVLAAHTPQAVAPGANASGAAESSQESSGFISFLGLLLGIGASALGALVLVLRALRRRRDGGEAEGDVTITVRAPSERRSRERKSGEAQSSQAEQSSSVVAADQPAFEPWKGDRRKNDRRRGDRRRSAEGSEPPGMLDADEIAANGSGRRRRSDRVSNSLTPSVVFGAYRVDQEVVRLVEGGAHSIEVLSSRAPDDRRAIETALLKAIDAPATSEDGRRRARTALEDYGFAARQCAALLLSDDTYERVAAAQTLGKMQSATSLPFLLEALYDGATAVRTEAVVSLGSLGLPSAIGALLDIARRHPELPVSLLGPVLTSCSFEPLESAWGEGLAGAGGDFDELFTGEITGFDPVANEEQLPEWLDDESLGDALERLESADVEVRISAAQQLAQFRVRRAVEALSRMARSDEAAAVRATAVTSLSLIDHESVFAPVLVAMGDDAREVRAAAARSLSRLSFERADAYVRLIETWDAESLRPVAQACVKAGLTAQALDRLASEDRRQAYEAFSLISLAVKAGETQTVLDAVESHHDTEVRLAAVRLLGLMGQPELLQQLREAATRGGVPERVRAAILETVHRAEQPVNQG